MLSLSSFYKLYIWLISIKQTIIIRKIISNGNDLINNPIYNRYNPQFKFFNEIIKYDLYNNLGELNISQRELPMNVDSNENIVSYNNASIRRKRTELEQIIPSVEGNNSINNNKYEFTENTQNNSNN